MSAMVPRGGLGTREAHYILDRFPLPFKCDFIPRSKDMIERLRSIVAEDSLDTVVKGTTRTPE